jgi:hypothetical protein
LISVIDPNTISLDAPVASNGHLTEIMYGYRDNSGFESDPDYRYHKNVGDIYSEIIIPFTGSFSLLDSVYISTDTYTDIAVDSVDYAGVTLNTFNTVGGDVLYNRDITEFGHFAISNDKKTLSWDFYNVIDNDQTTEPCNRYINGWNRQVNLLRMTGRTIGNVDVIMGVSFNISAKKNGGEVVHSNSQTLVFYSTGDSRLGDVTVPIYKVRIKWGCFAAGTLITMADGTQKKIEDIKIDDKVKTLAGNAAVTQTTTGMEEELFAVKTSGGQRVFLTYNHPILTTDGLIDVNNISDGDCKIITEGGKAEAITEYYIFDYKDKVYNISTDESSCSQNDHIIFANGIACGDNYLQNNPKPLRKMCAKKESDSVNADFDFSVEAMKFRRMHNIS